MGEDFITGGVDGLDLSMGENEAVGSEVPVKSLLSNWNPHPDWQAGRLGLSYLSSQLRLHPCKLLSDS